MPLKATGWSGIDNIDNYYDVNLKYDRLEETGISKSHIQDHKAVKSSRYPNYRFIKADLLDKEFIDELFNRERFDVVCNFAAQPGVRYSIDHPYVYINSNILGFLNILEACRFHPVKHLVYASSSSVYGLNEKVPFLETDQVDSPVSLYAASKKSNELMAYAYSNLYHIPVTGVRFFTVYGPWGRPDMAPYLFMSSIISQIPVNLYNHGRLSRDFTYIDDIVEGLSLIIGNPPAGPIPYKIYNLGYGSPVRLKDFIAVIESVTHKQAIINRIDMQSGDVYHTHADTTTLANDLNYKAHTSVYEGIDKFYDWYMNYTKGIEKNKTFHKQEE